MDIITLEQQVQLFLAGFGTISVLAIPYVIIHFSRKAANAGIPGRD